MEDPSSLFKPPKGYQQYANPLLPDYSRDALKALIQKLSPMTSGAIDVLGQQARGGANIDQYRNSQMANFQSDIIPQILQQYGSFGSGRNSGLNNALASATGQLGQNLATRREGLQSDAISQLLGFNTQFLNMRPYEYGLKEIPEKKSKWMEFLGGSNGQKGGLENITNIITKILPFFI